MNNTSLAELKNGENFHFFHAVIPKKIHSHTCFRILVLGNEIITDSSHKELETSVEEKSDESANSKSNDAVEAEIKKLALSKDTPSIPTSSKNLLTDGSPEETLKSISEAGRFSLAAICALSLHDLFDYKWDEEFSTRSIKYITLNLQLPQKVSCCFHITKQFINIL